MLYRIMATDRAGVLERLGKIAGIGGIAAGVFLILGREFIRKNIFPKLPPAHAYNLLLLFILFTFAIAVLGLVIWAAKAGNRLVLLLLCFAIVMTVLGGWLVRKDSATSDATEFTLAEQKVITLKKRILELREDWENSNQYPQAKAKVNQDAPRLADDLLAVNDKDLDGARQILKYEYSGYALVMAASVEAEPPYREDKADMAMKVLAKSMSSISDARKGTSPENQAVAAWLYESKDEERVIYLEAEALCIKAKARDDRYLALQAATRLRRIPEFASQYPPSQTPDLQWCQGQK